MKKRNSLNFKQNLKKGDDVLVKSSKSLKAFISLIAIILSFSIFITPVSALIGNDGTIVDDGKADTLIKLIPLTFSQN